MDKIYIVWSSLQGTDDAIVSCHRTEEGAQKACTEYEEDSTNPEEVFVITEEEVED